MLLLRSWPPWWDLCLDLKGKLTELIIDHREYEPLSVQLKRWTISPQICFLKALIWMKQIFYSFVCVGGCVWVCVAERSWGFVFGSAVAVTTCEDANISELTGKILRLLTCQFHDKAGLIKASNWIFIAIRISSHINGSQSESFIVRWNEEFAFSVKHIARLQKQWTKRSLS